MSLRHTQADESVPLLSLPAEEILPPAQEQETPRYDAHTVQQIIALAEKLQTRHRETLTPDDIESLGREMGVEPEFVRRALAQIDTQDKNANYVPTSMRPKRVSKGIPRRVLTRRQRTAVMVPAAFYLLLAPFTFIWFPHHTATAADTNAMIGLFVALPAILALSVGIKGNSKRLGAFGGGLIGFAAFISMISFGLFHHWHQTSLGHSLFVLELWLVSTVTLGIVGAALRQIISEPFYPKRLRVRLVVEPTNHDQKQTGEWV